MASINPTTLSTPGEPYTGKGCYLKLHITKITQSDGGTNKTYIDWKITFEGTPWVVLYRAYCTLGGKVLYDAKPEKGDWRAGQTLASGTNVEFNNNTDGSLTLRAYLKQQYYYGNGDTSRWNNSYYYQEASTDMVCSKIARYFSSTPSMTFKDKTENQIRYNWSTPETCDSISLDGSGTKSITGLPGTSGVITITGLSANTSYSHTGTFRRKDSQLTSNSAKQTNSTYDYPKPTALNDFTIGDGATVTLYNPLSRQCTLELISNVSGGVIGTYSGTYAGDVNGEFKTADAIAKQYASIPNVQSGTYYARVTYGSSVKELGTKTYRIKGNETPTFNESNITDVKDTLLADSITGLNTKIIKGHNRISGTIIPMQANYNANGKRYIVSANASPSSQEISYATINKTFTFDNITANSFTVTAYDSRELPTARNKTIDLVDYSVPKINNFVITRQNGIGEYAILNADGTNTYWKGWSQIKKYNTIQKVYYRYKPSGSSAWSVDWIDISSSLTTNNEGNWAVSKTLDIKFTTTTKYDFQLYVEDLLESSQPASNTLSTANGFLWRDLKNKFLGINKKPTCALDVNGDVNVEGNITSQNKVQAKEVVATQIKANTLYQNDKAVLDYDIIENGIMKYKNYFLSESGIQYPALNNLNDIGDVATTKRMKINWYPTQSSGQQNGPNGSDGLVFTFSPHPDYVYQLAYTGGNPVRVFTRSKYVNVWYGWKELLLKEELPSIPKIPQLIGTYPLLHVPYNSSTAGSYQIGNVYSFKEALLEAYPLKDGFTRTYKVMVDATTSTNNLYIYLGGYEIGSVCVWGANSPHHSRTFVNDITNIVNSIGNGHCSLNVNNVNNGSGTWYYLNSITLLIYDTYNK